MIGFEECQSNCIFVGLSFFEAETHIPNEKHDQKLDLIVSPNNIHEVNAVKFLN